MSLVSFGCAYERSGELNPGRGARSDGSNTRLDPNCLHPLLSNEAIQNSIRVLPFSAEAGKITCGRELLQRGWTARQTKMMSKCRIASLAMRDLGTHCDNGTARKDGRGEFPEFTDFEAAGDIRCGGLQNATKKRLGLLCKIICALDPDKEAILAADLLMEDFAAFAEAAVGADIPAEEGGTGGGGLIADPAGFSRARFAAYEQRTFPGSRGWGGHSLKECWWGGLRRGGDGCGGVSCW